MHIHSPKSTARTRPTHKQPAMPVSHPIPRAFTRLVMEYIEELAGPNWDEYGYPASVVYGENATYDSFYELYCDSWEGNERDEDELWKACLEHLTPLESAQLASKENLSYTHRNGNVLEYWGADHIFEQSMRIWEEKLIGGVQREFECARDIQRVWRGYDARWKNPCFSFKDSDGDAPPAKKQRAE